MAAEGGPNIIEDGLVLYLDAANKKSYPGSGTTWSDLSANEGTASINNNPTFSSEGYFDSDGVSDYFRFERSDLNAGTFSYDLITVFLWYKPSASGDTDHTGNNLITVENSFEISVGNNSNGFHGLYYASNPWAWYGTTANVLVNEKWNLITYVHESTIRRLYVNGIEVFTRNNTGNIAAGSSSYPYLTLMGRYSGTSSNAEGKLAQVNLYSRVFSPSEILLTYNVTKSRFGL